MTAREQLEMWRLCRTFSIESTDGRRRAMHFSPFFLYVSVLGLSVCDEPIATTRPQTFMNPRPRTKCDSEVCVGVRDTWTKHAWVGFCF